MTFPVLLPMALGPLQGITGEVYRFERDWRGDPVNPDDPTNHLGTISGIVFGGRSVSARDGREERSDTTGQIGCPRDGIKLQAGDRIVIDGIRYDVVGPRLWDYPSNLTGFVFPLYFIEVRAVT